MTASTATTPGDDQKPHRVETAPRQAVTIEDFYGAVTENTSTIIRAAESIEAMRAEQKRQGEELARQARNMDSMRSEVGVLQRDFAEIKAVETVEKAALAAAEMARQIAEARDDEKRKAREAKDAEDKRLDREERWKRWGLIFGGGTVFGSAIMKILDRLFP